jgi:hypothetical protein
MMPRRGLGGLAVALLAVAFAMAHPVRSRAEGGAAARAAQAGDCPDVSFVGARGSGEPAVAATHGMGPSVDYLARRLALKLAADGETMRTLPVVYMAAGVNKLIPTKGQIAAMAAAGAAFGLPGPAVYYRAHVARAYFASIDEGAAQTITEARLVLANCPDTDLVFAGYSQGAIVMHQAELELQRQGDTDVLDAIVGTLLLADGDRTPRSAAQRFGTAAAGDEGVRTYLRLSPRRDVVDPDVTAEICDAGDVVCDFNLHRVAGVAAARRAAGVHTGYLAHRKRLLDAAVDWLADEIGADPTAPAGA